MNTGSLDFKDFPGLVNKNLNGSNAFQKKNKSLVNNSKLPKESCSKSIIFLILR